MNPSVETIRVATSWQEVHWPACNSDSQLAPRIGDLQTELIEEFFKAFVQEGRFNLHIESLYGRNQHHVAETIFKATARALHLATRVEHSAIPSTKGVL